MTKIESNQELDSLKAENARLKSELDSYKTKKHRKLNIKSILSWTSLSLAAVIFAIASLIFYITFTIIDTDRFMTIATPLAQQPAVQDAIAQKTTDALFEKVDVEKLASDVLPDRVDFLAPTVAEQIKKFTKSETQKIIASDKFQEIWQTSISTAHSRFINALENYEGDGTININDVYNKLSERLEEGKLSFLANKTLPSKIGNITVLEASWLPTAHLIVANADTVRILTIFIFALLLGLTIWLSSNRRRAIIHIGFMLCTVSLLILIVLRIARETLVGGVNPQYQQAFLESWAVIISPFGTQLIASFIFGLIVVIIAWLGGGSRSSVVIQTRVNNLLSGKLHQSIFGENETKWTSWIGKHQKSLLVSIATIFVLSFLFIPITLNSILWASFIAVIAASSIITLAAPANKK